MKTNMKMDAKQSMNMDEKAWTRMGMDKNIKMKSQKEWKWMTTQQKVFQWQLQRCGDKKNVPSGYLCQFAMEAMAHRKFDGLPNLKMVDLSMANWHT